MTINGPNHLKYNFLGNSFRRESYSKFFCPIETIVLRSSDHREILFFPYRLLSSHGHRSLFPPIPVAASFCVPKLLPTLCCNSYCPIGSMFQLNGKMAILAKDQTVGSHPDEG